MGGSEPPSDVDVGGSRAAALPGAADDFGLAGGAWAEWQEEDLAPGTDLGGFVIVRPAGRGGMGVVYEARQVEPPRTVAVKLIRPGVLAAATVRRFAQEARVLARLQHPHVAQIHAAGAWAAARGRQPFIVMEFVAGARSITEHAAAERLPIRERVAAVHRACAGVAHGHRRGVIHRDIKPGNILVDAGGNPKVIDFGVARPLDVDSGVAGGTTSGGIVGTLRYMSPEQLGAEPDDVDARTDVYSLGLVLHELVTGGLPRDTRGLPHLAAARLLDGRAATATEAIERAVRAEGRLAGDEARSLAAIVARCLGQRPADRYSTAAELEADLGRWLAGEAVLARPLSTRETLLRLARRHRLVVAAGAVAAAAVLLAAVGMTALAVRAEAERRRAVEAGVIAEARRQEADRRATETREQLYVSQVLLGSEARDRGNLAEARRLLAAARGLADAAGTRQPLELDCLAASLDESIATLPGDGGTVHAVAWSADGRRLASGAADGTVRILTISSAEAIETSPIEFRGHEKEVWGLAFSPDGRLLATASADGTAAVWESVSGRLLRRLEGHGGPVYAAAFAPDGSLLATASRDRTVRLWETASWQRRRVLRGHEGTVYAAAFSGDGRLLATASQDRTARIYDVATGTPVTVLVGHTDRVFRAEFAADGARLATASLDGTARVWDVSGGPSVATLEHPYRVNAVAFVGGGERIATAAGDGVLRVWDVATGREATRLRGHLGHLWSLAIAPDSARAATGAADGTVRIWDLDERGAVLVRGDEKMLAVAAAGDEFAIGTAAGTVLVCDPVTVRRRGARAAGGERVRAVAYTPDGRTLAAAGDDGRVRLWTRGGDKPPLTIAAHERRVYAVAFTAAGERLATASEDRTARIWKRASGEPASPPLRHPQRCFGVAFSPDGRLLATACADGVARLWDAGSGAELTRCTGHGAAVNWVAVSPDGGRLATASSDGTVRLWGLPDGRPLAVFTGPARQVWKVAFSPDGMRVAAASADGTAQLWDAASGRPVATLRGHTDEVWGVAFLPDGRGLLTASWDGTTRLWGVPAAAIARRRAAAP